LKTLPYEVDFGMRLLVKNGLIGLGAFIQEAVGCGELLVDWSDHPFFAERPWVPAGWKFIQIAPGVLSGPQDPEGHPDAFINHSCTPNAEIRFENGVRLFALRAILAGEEITFDYAKLYPAAMRMACACKATDCRRVIVGKRLKRG
jgi:hypothetical protein